ncbi:MAG TPA: hypothetical protein DCX21_05885 [Eubacterium sp.]|nr:hypothetical protein [Eubacterium sp.]
MWIDDDRLTEIEDCDTGIYPKKCPICGNNTIHKLMYRYSVMSSRGGSWIWCSSCKRYSHTNAIIPEWWSNYDGLEVGQLYASPEHNIDEKREAIDRWINKLISLKPNIPEKKPESITEDKTLYVIRIIPQKVTTEEKAEFVAYLCRCDKNQALELIKNEGYELFPMPAIDIRIVKKELEAKDLSYVISPEYKW